jgi:putative membrane protein
MLIRLITHVLVTALLLVLVSYFVRGIVIASFGTALIAALVLGLVNFFVRPVLVILTLPITLVTLGLFLLVINACMLLLTSALVHGFHVAGFGAAFVGGLLLAVFNLLVSAVLRSR